MIENEMEAKSSDDVHERLTEDSWHPRIKSINYGVTNEKCIKGEIAQVEQLVNGDIEAKIPGEDHEKLVRESRHPNKDLHDNEQEITTLDHQRFMTMRNMRIFDPEDRLADGGIEQAKELVSNRTLCENACEVCERAFRESRTLRLHILRDHGTRSIVCIECDTGFFFYLNPTWTTIRTSIM